MPGYSQAWESHVLATLSMWSELLPLFLRQTAGRASAYGNPVLADLLNVLHVLQAAPQLAALLQSTEASLDAYQGSSGSSSTQVMACPVKLQTRPPAEPVLSACLRLQGAHADLLPFLAEQSASWRSYATGGSQQQPVCPLVASLHACHASLWVSQPSPVCSVQSDSLASRQPWCFTSCREHITKC